MNVDTDMHTQALYLPEQTNTHTNDWRVEINAKPKVCLW